MMSGTRRSTLEKEAVAGGTYCMQVAMSVRLIGYRLRSFMKIPSCWDATDIAWSWWGMHDGVNEAAE